MEHVICVLASNAYQLELLVGCIDVCAREKEPSKGVNGNERGSGLLKGVKFIGNVSNASIRTVVHAPMKRKRIVYHSDKILLL